VQIIDGHHPLHLLLTWPGYSAVVASIIALWLMQSAFNAAPLHASLPAVTAAEPTAGIVLGVVVFGDRVHISPWLVTVQVVGVVIMVTGVILVARAPVFRDLRLRELPHGAIERLQHPPSDYLGASAATDEDADGLAAVNGLPLGRPTAADSPGDEGTARAQPTATSGNQEPGGGAAAVSQSAERALTE
jgi:multidrug transporter EmrE-like cation transporter